MKILKYSTLIALLFSTQLLAETKCNPEGNQMELNVCASDDLEKADKALNSAYKELIKLQKDNKSYLKKLKVSQRLWIKFRDAEIETIFACDSNDMRMCWGSMYDLSFHSEMQKLTEERTATLKEYIKDLSEN